MNSERERESTEASEVARADCKRDAVNQLIPSDRNKAEKGGLKKKCRKKKERKANSAATINQCLLSSKAHRRELKGWLRVWEKYA